MLFYDIIKDFRQIIVQSLKNCDFGSLKSANLKVYMINIHIFDTPSPSTIEENSNLTTTSR